MKIKEGYILREVAGNFVVVGVGAQSLDLNGIININETGAFIWRQLENENNADGVADALCAEYDIDKATALSDVNAFVENLRNAELIEE